ncbi:MAG: hypothetical protein Q8Q62_14605 [Mesorhizobium sp.]|nr:hypothetical protein [Mesorhizobium sp.]
MSEPVENAAASPPTSKLAEAIREVKNANADRDDVVVEIREASRMRLELLAQELAQVFAEVPADDRQFDFAISSGLQPRLWIDATAHVAMGRDRRVYRFVRDSRLGRVVLAESTDMKAVAEQVTRYVAERIVERQRMMDGVADPVVVAPAPQDAATAIQAPPANAGWGSVPAALTFVLIGGIAGVAGVLAYLWDKLPPLGLMP